MKSITVVLRADGGGAGTEFTHQATRFMTGEDGTVKIYDAEVPVAVYAPGSWLYLKVDAPAGPTAPSCLPSPDGCAPNFMRTGTLGGALPNPLRSFPGMRPSLPVPDCSAPNYMAEDLLEFAWGIIANAGGGNWSKESPEWNEAAKLFRERFFDRRQRP